MTIRKQIRIHVYSRFKALMAPAEIARYMSSVSAPRLNVGCGKNILGGWLNVDLYPHFGAVWMDAVSRWPFADQTFTAGLCEHMIEHVPKTIAVKILKEFQRTLQPGGVLRIVTPDFATFARIAVDADYREGAEYVGELQKVLGREVMTPCDAINEMFYGHGHRYIYTVQELSRLLAEAGFTDLKETRGGFYFDPVFKDADGHIKVIGGRVNEIEAFAIEARRVA